MPSLLVIVASTREERVGRLVADWFVDHAKTLDHFDQIELADLKELSLPMLDEPHPLLRQRREQRRGAPPPPRRRR